MAKAACAACDMASAPPGTPTPSCNGAKDGPTPLQAVSAHKPASRYQTSPVAMGLTPPLGFCRPMREESSKDEWRGNSPLRMRLTNLSIAVKARRPIECETWHCCVDKKIAVQHSSTPIFSYQPVKCFSGLRRIRFDNGMAPSALSNGDMLLQLKA